MKKGLGERAEIGDVIGLKEAIFIILNVIFFITMLLFVHNAGSRGFVYEESYAKQIAMAIDSAQPGTAILLDVGEGLSVAEKNGVEPDRAFVLDKEKNSVEVRLSSNGYSYKYFSDYDAELNLSDKWLSIVIK